jgi:hypothetical protein
MAFYFNYSIGKRLMFVYYIENLSPDGTPSQSSLYYWTERKINLTADLAISGGPNDDFASEGCAVTLANPIQYVAWWMLTFPVAIVYITNVKIYYRESSKLTLSYVHFI